MAVYAYKARAVGGHPLSGSITSDTPATARQQLRQQGLKLLDVRPMEFKREHRTRIGRRSREQAADFARQLALLLRAGIPLVEAMDVLAAQQTGKLKAVLQDLRDRVSAGASLSDALEVHPGWFDPVFRTAVKTGQLCGRMDQSLVDMSAYLKEAEGIRTRLVNALAYPGILLVLGTGVVLFLMSYVVPQLLTVLEASGRALPLPTRALKSISDFLLGHWMLLAICAGSLVVGVVIILRWETARRFLHRSQLRTPLIGVLLKKTLVAQFSQMMALMMQNGVPFLDALRLVKESCRNLVLKDELSGMQEAVERGSDIAPTLRASRIFPPLVVHIVNVGQRAGELTEMLGELRVGYETEVRLAVSRLATVLEPALIVILSGMVGFVVLATLLPILETTRAIL